MSKTKNTVSFNGTAEQKEELLKVIAEKKNDKGALMPILQKAQDIYGYLPIEVQTIISDELNIPLEKIYGVATFYSQFSLNPKGNIRYQSVLVRHAMLKAQAIFSISFRKSLASPAVNVHLTVNSLWKHAAVSEPAVLHRF